MAVDIKFLLDGEDRGQPINYIDFGISITEDTNIQARIVSFDNALTFIGETYEYIFNKVIAGEHCNLINVEVQYLCGNLWKKLVDGYFVITESDFDLDRCSVNTKLYDESFSTKINNNKSIPFYSDTNISKNLLPISAPLVRTLLLFNPTNGNYIIDQCGCISVYDAFKHLVNCMSDGLIDFESTFFKPVYVAPNLPKTYVVTNAAAIRNKTYVPTQLIFDKLYIALNKKLRLGMGFEKQPNGRPLLRIEKAEYFFNASPSVVLEDQPSITMRYDTESLIAGVDFGANPFFNKSECNNGATPCSFLQTAFYGFRDESFGILGTCNTSKMLNLRSDDVIFDTNIIEDILLHNNTDYDLNMIVIYCDGNRVQPMSNAFTALQGDPLAAGDTIYNASLTNERVSANWLDGYPNSLIQYIVGFDPALTPFNARILNTQSWTIFPVPPNGPQYYIAETGVPIKYQNEISDPYNLFDGEKYVVPYAGTYTFTARIALAALAPTPTSRVTRAVIRQYNSLDVEIGFYNGAVASDSGLGNIRVNVTATFPCNEGDMIRVDLMEYYTDAGLYASTQQDIITYAVDGSTNLYSEFFGSGVPFGNTDLQPVDPNLIRNVLYKFERPLSMSQINSILNATSSPIRIGRTDDPLTTIDTHIKSVNIDSVIKQMAKFDLRSNKILI
jgi:hypothetical protein